MAPKKKAIPPKDSSTKKLEPQLKKTRKSKQDDAKDVVVKRYSGGELFSTDVLMVIGSFVETIDIVRSMALVCKDWNQAVVSDGVFCEVFRRDFGKVEWFVDKINYNLSIDLKLPFDIRSCRKHDGDEDEEIKSSRPTPNPSANKLTLSEIQEILESTFGKGKFWYSLYRLVIGFIPIQRPKLITDNEIVLPLRKETKKKLTKKKKTTKKKVKKDAQAEDYLQKDVIHKVIDEDDEDDDDGFGSKDISSNYFYFSLGLQELVDILEENSLASKLVPALDYDLNTHKLAIILSLFDRHGLILEYFGKNSSHQTYLNKITKEYKDQEKKVLEYVFDEETRESIGALPRTPYIETLGSFLIGYDSDNHPCSILQFCYAILCGKETELFKGTRREPEEKSTFEDDFQNFSNVSIGPHTEDAFMPYCDYEIIEKPRFDEYSYGVSNIAISYNPTNLHSTFISSFPGWVRGFWNANFYWYHVVEFCGLIVDFNDSDMLLVVHNQRQILHNLC